MLLRLPTRVRVAVLSSWSISGVQIWSKILFGCSPG